MPSIPSARMACPQCGTLTQGIESAIHLTNQPANENGIALLHFLDALCSTNFSHTKDYDIL
jgi:hypothetical protein